MNREPIQTSRAPAAIGTYSQAIKAGKTVYISGQIPLDPATMEVVTGGAKEQIEQVFENLLQVAQAAGGSFKHVVKLTVYLVDLANFPLVNEAMARHFSEPYPARAAIEVSALPKNVAVEADAILVLD